MRRGKEMDANERTVDNMGDARGSGGALDCTLVFERMSTGTAWAVDQMKLKRFRN